MTALALADDGARITDREYEQLRRLVLDTSGIALGDARRQLVVGRLARRLRELGVRSYGEYHDRVRTDPSGVELVELLDRLTTNETSFFRERQHWALLAERVLPGWRQAAREGRRARRVRAWSAACATGQEPFSLAMVLLEQLPPDEGWEVEVLATDLSTRALRAAASATWPLAKAGEIPAPLLRRWMLRGTGAEEGRMRAAPELRRVVHFQRLNLAAPTWPVPGQFDLVFCRNVMIYFAPEVRTHVVDGLASRVAPGGYLFVGHAESIQGARDRLRAVIPTVYAPVAP